MTEERLWAVVFWVAIVIAMGYLVHSCTVTTAPAWGANLLYTAAAQGQHCYRVWSEADQDSVTACDCVGTAPLVEMQTVYLWGQPVSGGGFALLDSQRVAPGAPGSFVAPFAGNFYTVQRNSKGLSCPSPLVTLLPSVTTGVEPEPSVDSPCSLFDVSGRRVARMPRALLVNPLLRPALRLPSGVYFLACDRAVTRKLAVLR